MWVQAERAAVRARSFTAHTATESESRQEYFQLAKSVQEWELVESGVPESALHSPRHAFLDGLLLGGDRSGNTLQQAPFEVGGTRWDQLNQHEVRCCPRERAGCLSCVRALRLTGSACLPVRRPACLPGGAVRFAHTSASGACRPVGGR